MDAIDSFLLEKPSGRLYHYTGVAGLIGILQSHQLWASDYRHLNDREEYRLGAKLLGKEVHARRLNDRQRNHFRKLVEDTQRACYVLSLSERGDQLSQWRAYCPGGSGYALGFGQKNGLFRSAKQQGFNLVRCIYVPRKQQELCRYIVDSFVDGLVTKKSWYGGEDAESNLRAFFEHYQWRLALALAMSALKHSGFEEEQEWRLVSQYPDEVLHGVAFRPGRFGVTPYFNWI